MDFGGRQIYPNGPKKQKQKTKTKNLKVNHPYQHYMDSSLWQIIDKAIDGLVENQDIEETTHRSYIVE